ncbi:hypothetical protein AGR13a_Lc110332 [Agrobacterium genomosp. 13 str. CFBP 6927]|uniref:Uncharacterized protein n=1 Tax=Agrobacterium genomosp. 13 str. CFBP 6927 TaxID=1183428 RepID=A0ABP2BLF1_9HYPH|nr:hypothetical protein AGR13a_Lc110332 [Agrobacterium genomosp. 13 str. CFBP 6927]
MSTIVATVAFVRHIAELSHYQSILVQPELAGFQWMEKCFCMLQPCAGREWQSWRVEIR